jgi:hypothetical protein
MAAWTKCCLFVCHDGTDAWFSHQYWCEFKNTKLVMYTTIYFLCYGHLWWLNHSRKKKHACLGNRSTIYLYQ